MDDRDRIIVRMSRCRSSFRAETVSGLTAKEKGLGMRGEDGIYIWTLLRRNTLEHEI